MVASRRSARAGMGIAGTKGRTRRRSRRLWIGAVCMALAPTSFGSNDIDGLLAHRGGAAHHSHEHLTAAAFGTIEPAIFSYGVQPVGTAIPRPPAIVLINFDPRALASIDWTRDPQPPLAYPGVNRDRKGDRLLRAAPAPVNPAPLPQPQRADVDPPATTAAPAGTPPETHMRAGARPAAQFEAEVPPAGALGVLQSGADIYFALDLTGPAAVLERWAPGTEPVMVTASDETGIKSAAREGGNEGPGGESVVGQGDVSRLGTPAHSAAARGSRRRSVLPRRSISRRAASRCAGRRPSRRW